VWAESFTLPNCSALGPSLYATNSSVFVLCDPNYFYSNNTDPAVFIAFDSDSGNLTYNKDIEIAAEVVGVFDGTIILNSEVG
jgi:hypothetical protein